MGDIKKFLDSGGLAHFCKKFQDYPSNEILGSVINAIDNTKVDKIEGKNLSTNDYTDEDKNKLDSSITFNEQILTESQQAQARKNIGAAGAGEVSQLKGDISDFKDTVLSEVSNSLTKTITLSQNKGIFASDPFIDDFPIKKGSVCKLMITGLNGAVIDTFGSVFYYLFKF